MDHKESFLQYLQIEKRYSPLTVRSYIDDLNQFHEYLASEEIEADPDSVTSHDIRLWIVELMEKDYSPASIRRKVSSLRGYYRYLRKQGIAVTDPVARVVLPKIRKSLPIFVELKSIDNLFDNFDFGNNFKGQRNRAVIEMLYMTGMRRAELTGLRDADVDLADSTVKVTGKRNKQRIIPLLPSFIPQLEEYKKVRDFEFPGAARDWFFVGNKGNKMYDKYVYNIVRRYLAMVTTIEKKSPHILRHTFATHMLNKGADLNSIKEFLGHANLSATQIYTHNSFEKLKEVYTKAHPRA